MSTMLANIAVAWTRAWGEGDTTAFEEIAADNYTRHSKTGQEPLGSVIQQIEDFHHAFSNFKVSILHAVEDTDVIAIHWRAAGCHTGDFMEVPPTNRHVAVDGASFLHHDGSRITEEYVMWDPRELLSAMKIVHLGSLAPVQTA